MDNYYMTVHDLIELGFGRDGAYEVIHAVRDELEKQGYMLPGRIKAPRKAVMKKLGIEEV